jgi:hypothetical protein
MESSGRPIFVILLCNDRLFVLTPIQQATSGLD